MENLFNNTQNAFSLKSDTELERAYFLFKLIANEPLVKIGSAVTNFALKASLPIEGLIRATVFDHFCSGINEDDSLKVVDSLFTKGVSSVLDYSVEGKEEEDQFDAVLEKTLKLIDFAKERSAIPFAVFKPTGFGRFKLYELVSEGKTLSLTEQQEWSRVVARFEKVCKASYDSNVGLLIDAEESWIQDAVDNLVEEMMFRYNKQKTIIFGVMDKINGFF
jgi:proline dehydrogenase